MKKIISLSLSRYVMDSETVETLKRQLSNLIRLATVIKLDSDLARVKVAFQNNQTGWIPWTTARAGNVKTWSPPSIGEQVVMLCPNGATEQALCLPALYKNDCPAPDNSPDNDTIVYPDGATICYNAKVHSLSAILPAGAITIITSNGGLTFNGNVSINGNVSVKGSINASGNISDSQRSMSADRGIYNNHTHTGNMGSPTSPPEKKQ